MTHRRATFLRTSGTPDDPAKKHLHIVLTDPFGPADQVLTTSVATIRSKRYDDTCILKPGCHELVVDPSYVVYRAMILLEVRQIQSCLTAHEYVMRSDVDEEMYYRVARGAFVSTQCPRFAREVLRQHDLLAAQL